jgi:hypothetical protein
LKVFRSRHCSRIVLAGSIAALLVGPREAPAAAKPFEPASSYGLYVIGGTREERTWSRLVTTEGVKGVALSATWADLEPRSGQYDWSELDARIDIAARAGKKVGLRVLPGISTPEWVFDAGAARFAFVDTNPNHGERFYKRGHRQQTFGRRLAIPVPWDEKFLAAWEGFVAALGKHCKDAPFAMVHVTGPTRHSAEMVLPHEAEDIRQWKTLGYAPDKLVGAWKRCVDAFARAFPNIPVVLNLSPTILKDGVTERVVQYAFEEHGRRLFLQNNILLADNKSMRREDWDILQSYASKTTIGFQRQILRLRGRSDVAGEDERQDVRRTNFAGMLEKGLGMGARYFEIGAADARDFPDIVRDTASRLAR